ncbi:putative phosphoserine phosphatase 2 [mine drainage metagenome]|uniref:Putative phosphoserine phosphatase 2 n=1 Tax=mine drainage metagenome TaxID=410659 RepID=A0A1J5QDU7_9ZZZZ
MALTLYLVRHGRTVYNDEHRLQGWCDSRLTDDGAAGVAATAQHLRPRSFAAAYASPSGRTVATADMILTHHPGTVLTTDDDLRELSFGDFEAAPEEVLHAHVDPWELFARVFDGTHPGLPGGESAAAYLSRVRAGFTRIEEAHRGESEVLVVSHGVTLAAYLTLIGSPPTHPLPNASISTVEISEAGGHRVTSFGVDPSGQGVPELRALRERAALRVEPTPTSA